MKKQGDKVAIDTLSGVGTDSLDHGLVGGGQLVGLVDAAGGALATGGGLAGCGTRASGLALLDTQLRALDFRAQAGSQRSAKLVEARRIAETDHFRPLVGHCVGEGNRH